MSRLERYRRRLEVLRKRHAHVEARAARIEAEGKGASYDRAEASALKWAIKVCEEYVGRLVAEAHQGDVAELVNDAKGG